MKERRVEGKGFIVRRSRDEIGQWGGGGDKRKETRGSEVGRYNEIYTHVYNCQELLQKKKRTKNHRRCLNVC